MIFDLLLVDGHPSESHQVFLAIDLAVVVIRALGDVVVLTEDPFSGLAPGFVVVAYVILCAAEQVVGFSDQFAVAKPAVFSAAINGRTFFLEEAPVGFFVNHAIVVVLLHQADKTPHFETPDRGRCAVGQKGQVRAIVLAVAKRKIGPQYLAVIAVTQRAAFELAIFV
ncbi:hypothetical protein D3C85_1372540 [compost metagenome]